MNGNEYSEKLIEMQNKKLDLLIALQKEKILKAQYQIEKLNFKKENLRKIDSVSIIRTFINEIITLEHDSVTPKKEVYDLYMKYANNLCLRPIPYRTFCTHFLAHFTTSDNVENCRPQNAITKYRYHAFKGIALKTN